MKDWFRLEQIALAKLEEHNLSAPVNPDILAKKMKLTVESAKTDGMIVGSKILVDETLRGERRLFAIAHEIAHILLRLAGIPDQYPSGRDRPCVNYLAAALLLPRDDFERDLKRYGWDLLLLKSRHRFASFEALARRIVALRSAEVLIMDKPLPPHTKKSDWYRVPYDRSRRPTREEKTAAWEAFESGAPVELRAGLTAWPVIQDDWIRVIIVTAL